MHKISRNTRVVLSIFIFISMVSLACGVPARILTTTQPTPAVELVQVVTTSDTSPTTLVTNEDQVLVDMYSRLNPSVVNITVYLNQDGQLDSYAQGSGFVYDDQGHVLTNAHVVHGSDAVEVTFSDGLIREASVVGEDLHSDLAVLQVELPEGVTAIPLGEMDNLAVGQTVVAIGNPFGLEGTLTRGIISALGRTIPALTIFSIPQAIQTDAAINPGNSGGPLLNLNGEVIGVNAQIETNGTTDSNIGVGFAIPVSIIQRVVPALIETGHYDWPYLGVSGYTVNPPLVKAMNLPVEQGAYVSTVPDGGPALAAGLHGTTEIIDQDGRQVEVGGDIITAIDGQPVKTFDDILLYLTLQTTPGQTVILTILRDGQYQDISLQLGTRPTG
ncbi:MAG: trypsin-like serine protease [Anaerolineae bacterium]|nr:trypsin-like serine protease [Anaerolineae bacterium]